MIDYDNVEQLVVEFEKRRVHGDARDFDIFEVKVDEGGINCVVPEFSGYTYPELIGDPENKRTLSINAIKDAFREFIRFKVSHAPEGTIYERINPNKPTFHDVDNSILVSLQSYQKMIEGRKAEYFGTRDIYKEDPKLAKIIEITQKKEVIIKQMNEGKISRQKAKKKATPLQVQITDIEGQFIKEHVENNLGKVQNTLHDTEIPQVPLKLHIIPPNDQSPFGALVTSGMSAYSMKAPSMAEPIVAELFMLLSPEWYLLLENPKKNDFYWPIDRLFRLTKYVHGNGQWFSLGHTFGNGDPPKPFAKNTDLCAFLFKFPEKVLPPTFCELKIGRKPVYFLQVLPIYKEEMYFLMDNSPKEFATLFKNSGVPEFTTLGRENLCAGGMPGNGNKSTFCRNCGAIIRDIDPKKKKIKCEKCGEDIWLD